MDDTTKVLIGTIAGFIIAFFAEPVKIYFQNRTRKKSLEVALYKELYANMKALSMYLRGEDKRSRNLIRSSFRFDAYNYAIKDEIAIFFQIREATTIRSIFLGFELMLSEKNSREHSIWVDALRSSIIEVFERRILEKNAFVKANEIAEEEIDLVIENIKAST